MKKQFKFISLLIFATALILPLTQCADDEKNGTTYYKLSGLIMQPDGSPADGAIITLSTLANAANIVSTTVSDETGAYSIMGVEKGTYYLNASFDPANTNNLKSANAVVLMGKEIEVVVEGNTTENITIEGKSSTSTTTFSLDDGWTFDGTHSTFEFEFPYDAANAVFTGHFSRAGFDMLDFDAATPENTKIKAWVDVVSVETGAPSGVCGHGRDGITGCIAGTFGVELDPLDVVTVYCEDGTMNEESPNIDLAAYDLWGDASTTSYEKQSSIVESTGVATFESTSVSAYGNGYIAQGNFTFNGSTSVVNLYFNYLEGYEDLEAGTNGRKFCSFFGWFKFKALDDYDIVSGHVGSSEVTVKVSAQFRFDL